MLLPDTSLANLRQSNPPGKSLRERKSCPALALKIFCFHQEANHLPIIAVPFLQEGRLAIVTKRGTGCGGREASSRAVMRVDERRRSPAKPLGEDGRSRTAKSCGPDAPMLVSSLVDFFTG
jgi:hypothetical protein